MNFYHAGDSGAVTPRKNDCIFLHNFAAADDDDVDDAGYDVGDERR